MQPRKLSIVAFSDTHRKVFANAPETVAHMTHKGKKYLEIKAFVYLGGIPNLPGLCLVSDLETGHLFISSPESFTESTDAVISPEMLPTLIERSRIFGKNTLIGKIRSFFESRKSEIGSQ